MFSSCGKLEIRGEKIDADAFAELLETTGPGRLKAELALQPRRVSLELSALMISAAYFPVRNLKDRNMEQTFSAAAYTGACRCAAGTSGKMPASTILRFFVP